MSITYKPPEPDVLEILDEARRRFHEPLELLGVTTDVLFAVSTDAESGVLKPALKKNKQLVVALASITPPKLRAKGLADTEILIDAFHWEHFPPQTHLAVLDHELKHFALQLAENGYPQFDDYGRPLLTMRPHAYEIGHFPDVAARHGLFSIELQQMRQIYEGRFGPALWQWAKDEPFMPPPGKAFAKQLELMRAAGETELPPIFEPDYSAHQLKQIRTIAEERTERGLGLKPPIKRHAAIAAERAAQRIALELVDAGDDPEPPRPPPKRGKSPKHKAEART